MVKSGWIHPCDDHDKFFLNILWDNIVSLIKNFSRQKINVVVDYVFSKDQIFSIVNRIEDYKINIKVVVISSKVETIIQRDRHRSGAAFVGEERIRQIVEDFNSDIIPERYILENNDAHLDDLVNTILNEDRFIVNNL